MINLSRYNLKNVPEVFRGTAPKSWVKGGKTLRGGNPKGGKTHLWQVSNSSNAGHQPSIA
jgi:hypothetical protein